MTREHDEYLARQAVAAANEEKRLAAAFGLLKDNLRAKQQARNYDEYLKHRRELARKADERVNAKRAARLKAKRDARVQSMRWVQLTCAECGNSTVVPVKDVPETVCQKCACHYATSLDCFAEPEEKARQGESAISKLWDLATTMHTEDLMD